MNYRVLKPEEWPRLQEYLAPYNYAVPSPQSAIVAIAEDDAGQICGALFQQLIWHREPIVITNPRARFDKLNSALNEAFTEFPGTTYYAFTENLEVLEMAKRVGMKPQNGVLLRGSN